MKPVLQTEFYNEDETGKPNGRGNCLIACIASLMEFPIEAVPPFHYLYDKLPYMAHVNLWLSYYGKKLTRDSWEQPGDEDERYFIVSGPSPRGDQFKHRIWHACIWYKGKIVHDPHPENTGLKKCQTWSYLEYAD